MWEDASNLAWLFSRDDDSLIEISEEEAIIKQKADVTGENPPSGSRKTDRS